MPSYGYIPLFRQLENWEWYKTDYMVRLWVHLLMKRTTKTSVGTAWSSSEGNWSQVEQDCMRKPASATEQYVLA